MSEIQITTTGIFAVDDIVTVLWSGEGYNGRTGKIITVFPSGRCQVAIGPIVILNLPPEALKHDDSKK